MAKRGPKIPKGKPLPKDVFAQGMVFFFEHLNGKTWKKMAQETGKDPATVAKYAKLASDEMVIEAKDRIMRELLPTVIALQKARMEWEIKELAEGRMPSTVNHSDRFLKGMFLFDDKPQPPKEIPQLPQGQLGEGMEETVAGLVRTRRRIANKQDLLEKSTEVIEGETVSEKTQIDG